MTGSIEESPAERRARMFFTENKLRCRINEVESYRYRDRMDWKEFAVLEDLSGAVNPEIPQAGECPEDWDVLKVGDYWRGRDRYLWMHHEVELPKEWDGRRAVGVFDFGNTGAGNNSGFESMCYLDGKPFQGVDVNHQEVFFPKKEDGKFSLMFRLWSGLEGGGTPVAQEHKIKTAYLAWLDEKADDFYYLGTLLLDTIELLEEANPIRYELLIALDEACMKIDWSYPGSQEFYKTLHDADAYLNQKIDGMEKSSEILVRCVGHTHIDMAWLWRLKHTREKASRSFSTVLRMMEMFPEYIFLQTQPQLYAYIKEDFPEIYEKIKERAAQGRWEVDGGMWVEADCNLTSGESLTRQLLLGCRFIRQEFGKEVEYLWLPDVFGYSWALPQILKKSGIDMFMTTKISWNQYNRMPHDTFRWIGIDGSEVLTHFITTPEPDAPEDSWFYTYNGQLTPRTVQGIWKGYSEKEMNRELLLAYGYGDGGGGVNRDMLERRRRLDKIPGLPKVKTSTAAKYFRNLKETVAKTGRRVPEWDGELYLEYHRGTYTSQAYNKRMNRKMELLYRRAEMLAAILRLEKRNVGESQQPKLSQGWLRILTNQFHDIIPGSSIHEVYEDCRKDYQGIERIAGEVEEAFEEAMLSPKEQCYCVFNASSWELDEIVTVPQKEKGYFTDGDGRVLDSQRAGETAYIQVNRVPALGFQEILFHPGEEKQEEIPFRIEDQGRKLETPFYQISLNEYGQIDRLYDKECDREVLSFGDRANVLQMFEDKPLGNDAWDIDIYYQEKMREVRDLQLMEVTEQGPLRLSVRMEWHYMQTVIRQTMTLYRDYRRIDFETWVNYQERQQLLKAAFPVDIRSTYASYDIQYGNVRRPNHWNTSWDQARFESVAHRFADLSEHQYGVSLLNDCKYGYDVKGNCLRISLLRSGKQPDYLQDLGEHVFTYSLYPHSGDFIEGETVKAAHALNAPMKVMEGSCPLAKKSFFAFDTDGVELDAVKWSEDGSYLVARFHEYTGSKRKVTVSPGFVYQTCQEGDLQERPLAREHSCEDRVWKQEAADSKITVAMHPYEVITLIFEI